MHIEINPKSLQNLEQICEVLYKLHPSVLDDLVGMERRLGKVLGKNDINNLSLEQREILKNIEEIIKEQHDELNKEKLDKNDSEDNTEDYSNKEKLDKNDSEDDTKDYDFKKMVNIMHGDGDYPEDIFVFNRLLKHLQLDTYEYIPIKISVEVEDPVIGKTVRELVRALEKTKTPEQFYLNERELDYDAYFAEGYNLTMNEEQEKKKDDLFSKNDPEELKKLLIKEKLYSY